MTLTPATLAAIRAFPRNPQAVDNLARLLATVAHRDGRKPSGHARRVAHKDMARARIEWCETTVKGGPT